MRIRLHRPRSPQSCGPRKAAAAGAQATRSAQPRRGHGPQVKAEITRLVVEVGNRAAAWRSAAAETELAFQWWTEAAQGERDGAAAVYLAATEREETAANEYRRVWETCCTTVP
jgi:hypothetical protein